MNTLTGLFSSWASQRAGWALIMFVAIGLAVGVSSSSGQQPQTDPATLPATRPAAIPGTDPIGRLVQELADPVFYDKAKTELGARGRPAVPALIAAVENPDFKARDIAVICLGMIRDPGTVRFLIQCLGDKDWQVQGRAAYALSQIGGQPAKDALVAFLERCLKDDKDDSHALTKATEAMKELPDGRALPSLLQIVQEAADGKRKGYTVRYAAQALGKIGDGRASPALVRLLRPPSPYAESWDSIYLEAIKQCKGRAALPGLVAYVEALVGRMKNDPEPTPKDGRSMGPHRQEEWNARMYWLAIECLEAITSTRSEGATREQALKFWKQQAARAASQPTGQPATRRGEDTR